MSSSLNNVEKHMQPHRLDTTVSSGGLYERPHRQGSQVRYSVYNLTLKLQQRPTTTHILTRRALGSASMATEMTLCVRGAAQQRELPRHSQRALQLWAALAAQPGQAAIHRTQI